MEEKDIQLNYYPISLIEVSSGTTTLTTNDSTTQSIQQSTDKTTTQTTNTVNVPLSESNIATIAGGSLLKSGYFQSSNYVKGVSGFNINSDGSAEFSSGYFRGNITGASGTFSGTITASTGSIGGFLIGSDYIKDSADSFGLASTVTGSNDVRFWAGDTFANRATADLRIYEDGSIVATNINATGSIFATSGWIGSATALVYESQGINTGTTGWIRGGQTGYNTGTGYFLGYSSGAYKFSIGDTTTNNSLLWDGTDLIVNGTKLVLTSFFGDGSDGDVTISGDTTITSDMYYNNLTINSTKTLNTNGYRIFVKGTLTNNGTISAVGNAGGNASGITGGTAGAALTDGTIAGSQAGKAGANGVSSNCAGTNDASGTAGTNGAAQTNVIGNSGVGGGAGGTANGSGTGGAATSGGTATISTIKCRVVTEAQILRGGSGGFNTIYCNAGSGSGSSGAYNDDGNPGTLNSGAGGGSGSGGGAIVISAKIIVNSGVITVKGGNGGNGSAATGGNLSGCYGAGGGGGGGGNGGLLVIIYSQMSGSGTKVYSGGTGGTGGTGVRNQVAYAPFAGANGTDGNSGTLIELVV